MSKMFFKKDQYGKDQLVIEKAEIRFHNFEGRQTKCNLLGNRNVDVVLPDADLAMRMNQDGWNVKVRTDNFHQGEVYYSLNVKIKLDSRRPPKIALVNKRNQCIPYTEDMLNKLDQDALDDVTFVINAYYWKDEIRGTEGIKAYLDQMYFRPAPSIFDDIYGEPDDSELDPDEVPF